jgi:hypothetical protein
LDSVDTLIEGSVTSGVAIAQHQIVYVAIPEDELPLSARRRPDPLFDGLPSLCVEVMSSLTQHTSDVIRRDRAPF